MSQPTTQRPPQVSLASGIVMFSSVVVLLTVWERVTSLGSLETQEAISDVLADAPFDSLCLTVTSSTDQLRISCMVAAACAWFAKIPARVDVRPRQKAMEAFGRPRRPTSASAAFLIAVGQG